MTHLKMGRRVAAATAALALLVAGCGDDDDDTASGSGSDTEETTTTAGEGGDDTTTTAGDDGGDGEFDELCALASELDSQEDFPSAEQLERYTELAPEEISDAVGVAAPPLIEAAGDPVAFFAVFGDDDVEVAIEEINAFETENCGIEHEPQLGEQEPEDGANAVAVVATEYNFEIGDAVAGRTSFVMTNEGDEAHFMAIERILEGTLEEALAFEGDPEEAGLTEEVGGSGIAAPGGDVEVATVDLEAGDYAILCFIPGPDGTPHAFLGMAVPFTVS